MSDKPKERKMSRRLAQQVMKAPNYGHEWVNRLAVVLQTFDKMEATERAATLKFIKGRYSAEWPSDSY